MANPCTIITVLTDTNLTEEHLNGLLAIDSSVDRVAGMVRIEKEIFSCRPDDIGQHLAKFEQHEHYTFVGGASFTEGTSVHTRRGEIAHTRGFLMSDSADESLERFVEVTRSCHRGILQAAFDPLIDEEILLCEASLRDEPEDDWSEDRLAECLAIRAYLRSDEEA